MKKSVVYGVLASLFFAVTFVCNRSMDLGGGSWMWSASLRYYFTLPILWALLLPRDRAKPVFASIRRAPGAWFLWSILGFGLFYAPICFASSYGPSWLVAGSWQISIAVGALLSPLFHTRIPVKSVLMSGVILAGVFLLQVEQATTTSPREAALGLVPILIASLAYPLGNRKMMALCGDGIDTTQRVFGMTLCSMPFWLALGGAALVTSGIPSASQVGQSLVVAVFSGVIATILFFQATNNVRHNPHQLAVAETTQASEVIFVLLGGVLLLGDPLPTVTGCAGLALIVAGIGLNAALAAR